MKNIMKNIIYAIILVLLIVGLVFLAMKSSPASTKRTESPVLVKDKKEGQVLRSPWQPCHGVKC